MSARTRTRDTRNLLGDVQTMQSKGSNFLSKKKKVKSNAKNNNQIDLFLSGRRYKRITKNPVSHKVAGNSSIFI